MKKILLVILAIVITAVVFAGCGGSSSGGNPVTDKLKSVTGSNPFGGDYFHDKAAAQKLNEVMKEKAGSPLMIFQHMNIMPDSMRFARQDNNKKENVDEFVWHKTTGWKGPIPVKLTGDGELEDNIYNSDEVNWAAIPDFIAAVEQKAKENKMEKAKIESIMIDFNINENPKICFYASIEGERSGITAYGDIKTGALTEFNKR